MAKFIQNDRLKKLYGEVFTPLPLVEEMLSRLPGEVWGNPDLRWLDPAVGTGNFLVVLVKKLMEGLKDAIKDPEERRRHILENMVYAVDIQRKNTMLCSLRLDRDAQYSLNIACANSLEYDYWGGMEFDVVVGNPPYQDPNNVRAPIWQKFVEQAFCLCKNGGYICLVHPGNWRKPEHKMFAEFQQRDLIYLEIHSTKDGQETFNAGTRYDWYLLKNAAYSGSTIIKDESGVLHEIDITRLPYIPHNKIDLFLKMFSQTGEETCNVLFERTEYGTDKPWVSSEQTEEFVYPCIKATSANNVIKYAYSSKREGMFGIPKVVAGLASTWNALVDHNGDYGMTQHCFGIVADADECECIAAVLRSKEFRSIIEAIIWSGFASDWRAFKYFRKDFWKEFVD